jgi:hypothetical protein
MLKRIVENKKKKNKYGIVEKNYLPKIQVCSL